jgi:lipoate-protein ligase A
MSPVRDDYYDEPISAFRESARECARVRGSESDGETALTAVYRLLRNTPHDQPVLFLYRNFPCVVIGRNQASRAHTCCGREVGS